jgi:hypothetical protein
MIRITAEEFWPKFRDEVRRTGTLEALRNTKAWTHTIIQAAKTVCEQAGLKTGNELYLDVMGYEQREPGVNFNWDLRVAFEHENFRGWHDELCKLCHVVADLRVLVAYFGKRTNIEEELRARVATMGERMTRVSNAEWLFIFGPDDSPNDQRNWVAYVCGDDTRLRMLEDGNGFNPYSAFSTRQTQPNTH